MKPIRTAALASATLLLTATNDAAPPAGATGWERQGGCAWRNHWTDAHHSALAIDWAEGMVTLTLISDAFAGWSDGAAKAIDLNFAGAKEPVRVDATPITGPGLAILAIPFAPAVEAGLARNSTLSVVNDGRTFVSLDMAGTAETIAAVKACGAAPHDGTDDLDVE